MHAASQLDRHRLGLGIVFQHGVAHLPPPARLFVAAKWQRRVEDVVAVDPHCSGLELGGQGYGPG